MFDDGKDDEESHEPTAEPDVSELEPEEWDPEDDIGIDVPEVSTDLSEVPGDLKREFVSLVVIFNVAILAFSLGVMLVVFRQQWTLGGGLAVVGVLLFVRGYYRYRHREYQ